MWFSSHFSSKEHKLHIVSAQKSVYIAHYGDIHLPWKETSMIMNQTVLTSAEQECSSSNSGNLKNLQNRNFCEQI